MYIICINTYYDYLVFLTRRYHVIQRLHNNKYVTGTMIKNLNFGSLMHSHTEIY